MPLAPKAQIGAGPSGRDASSPFPCVCCAGCEMRGEAKQTGRRDWARGLDSHPVISGNNSLWAVAMVSLLPLFLPTKPSWLRSRPTARYGLHRPRRTARYHRGCRITDASDPSHGHETVYNPPGVLGEAEKWRWRIGRPGLMAGSTCLCG